MKFDEKEKMALNEMLTKCNEKFGEYVCSGNVDAHGCDSCTGSCMGHGISVWTACDIK